MLPTPLPAEVTAMLCERREPGGIILGSVMPWERATIVVPSRNALRAAVKASEAVAVFVMVGR